MSRLAGRAWGGAAALAAWSAAEATPRAGAVFAQIKQTAAGTQQSFVVDGLLVVALCGVVLFAVCRSSRRQ